MLSSRLRLVVTVDVVAIVVAFVAGLGACSPRSTVPEGAKISCVTDAECPAGYSCRPATGLCAPSSGDLEAPRVVGGSVVVTPEVVAPGRQVRVTFTVDEALFSLPVVHFAGDSGEWVVEATDALTYEASFVEPAAGADRVATAVVTLVDLSGNVATDATLGNVVIDHTLPALATDPLVAPAVTRPAGVVNLTLTATETLATPPTVTLFYADAATSTATLVTDDGSMTTTFEAMVPSTAVHGAVRIEVSLVDLAGNLGSVQRSDLFAIDAVAPAVEAGSLEVVLVPPEEALLSTVSRAAVGTRVVGRFNSTEPLGSLPVVEAAGTVVTVRAVGSASFVGTAAVGAATAEGLLDVRATLTDEAGNSATVDLFTVVIDHTGPAAPDVDSPTALIHRRALLDLTLLRKNRHVLLGEPGAVPVEPRLPEEDIFLTSSGNPVPEGHVLVFAEAIGEAIEIKRDNVGADGSFAPLEFPPIDVPQLFVAAVDRAGNATGMTAVNRTVQPLRVRNGLLHAALQHQATALPGLVGAYEGSRFFARRTEAPGFALAEKPFELASDGTTIVGRAGGTFVQLPTLQPLPPLIGSAAAYDATADRLVVFGGAAGSIPSDDTWELAPNGWVQRDPTVVPPARVDAAMEYFPGRGVIMHGGCPVFGSSATACAAPLDDLWLWDGEDWACLSGTTSPCTGGGTAAAQHVMEYDPPGNRLVMVTSSGSAYTLGSAATAWSSFATSGTAPVRLAAASTFDTQRRALIVFGGWGTCASPSPCSETFRLTFGGGTGTWAPLTPAEAPQGRATARIVYDRVSDKVLLFGGIVNSAAGAPSCDDTGAVVCRSVWSLDPAPGGTWTRLVVDDPEGDGDAPARYRFAAAYDDLRNRVLVAGGIGAANAGLTDSWTFGAPADDRPVHVLEVNLAAAGADLAVPQTFGVDFVALESEVYPGYLRDSGEIFGERDDGIFYGWDVDHIDSARSRGSPFAPDARLDSTNTLNTGGTTRFLWEAQTPNGSWGVFVGYGDSSASPLPTGFCMRAEANPLASGFISQARRFGSAEGSVVVNDGRLSIDLDPGCPSALDIRIGFVDLWPASTLVEEMQVEWVAGGRGKAASPPIRQVIYDHESYTSGSDLAVPLPADNRNPNREWSVRFAFDASPVVSGTLNNVCIVLDGGTPICQGPFAVRNASERVVSFDLGSAGLPDLTTFVVRVSYTGLPAGSWQLFAAPIGSTPVVDGATLWVLGPGGWESLANEPGGTNTSPPNTPTLLSYGTTDPTEISRLLFSPNNTLRFAVTPSTYNGFNPDFPRVSSDWARVVVRYRLPPP